MAISVSGLLTLACIVFGGPIMWAVTSAAKRARGITEDEDSKCEGVNEPLREQTDSTSYLMTLLGYSIGIGNLWRFPYLVGKWGGGAFLVAYLSSLFLVAMPLYLMELSMGHHLRQSTMECFRVINPRWIGLGLGQCLMIFFCLTYFNVIIAYCAIYVVGAVFNPLPWSPEVDAVGDGVSAASEFWVHHVLNKYPGSVEGLGLGPMQWEIAASLAFVLLVVFLSIAFGKKVLAKITWVTVVGPVVLLFVMLIQALRLEGAEDGVRFYIGKFDSDKLWDVELWATACSQILFSLSPGFGTAITMSSFTDPKTDVFRTCMVVSMCNSAFSITGGFAIFGILGNLAFRTGKTVAEVASASGPGLAFIAIADGIRAFDDGANAMAVLFFVMLMALGLDSTFAWAETLVSVAEDHFLAKGHKVSTTAITAVICLLLFLLGLPYCTRMGSALLDVVDHFVGSMFLLFACFVEVIIFNVCYKFRRLQLGLQTATGRSLTLVAFWRFCYLVPVPLFTGCLFLNLFYSAVVKPYEGYPAGLQALGWTLLSVCMLATVSTAWKQGHTTLAPLPEQDSADEEHPKEEPSQGA